MVDGFVLVYTVRMKKESYEEGSMCGVLTTTTTTRPRVNDSNNSTLFTTCTVHACVQIYMCLLHNTSSLLKKVYGYKRREIKRENYN